MNLHFHWVNKYIAQIRIEICVQIARPKAWMKIKLEANVYQRIPSFSNTVVLLLIGRCWFLNPQENYFTWVSLVRITNKWKRIWAKQFNLQKLILKLFLHWRKIFYFRSYYPVTSNRGWPLLGVPLRYLHAIK